MRRRLITRSTVARSVTGLTIAVTSLVFAMPSSATSSLALNTPTYSSGGFPTNATPGDKYTVNTSAPIIAAGHYNESLSVSGFSGIANVNSVTAPIGFTVEYADSAGTWSTTAPSTITAVRAVGTVTSHGISTSSGTAQQMWMGSSAMTHTNLPSLKLGINNTGDGWDVSFDPSYLRAYNVYHHNTPSALDCHSLITGGRCPGFPFNLGARGLLTNSHAHAFVNSDGNIYVSGTEGAKNGFQCVTDAAASCGFKSIFSDQLSKNGTFDNFVGGFSAVNGDLYGVDLLSGRLGCWDLTANAVCAGQPATGWKIMAAAPGAGNVQMDGTGDYLWIMTADTYQLTCFNTATQAKCSSAFPKTGKFDGLFAAPNNVATQACAAGGTGNIYCFNTAGTRLTALDGLAAAQKVLPTNNFWNTVTTVDHVHYYWTYNGSFGNAAVECFDASTGLTCPNYPITPAAMAAAPGGSSGTAYAAIPGPAGSGCLWTNSDDHELIQWNIDTAKAGCPVAASVGNADYTFTTGSPQLTPRMSCAGSDNTLAWGVLSVVSDTSNATSYSVSVKDSNGNLISGWRDLPMSVINAHAGLDLSALPVSMTGQTPKFVITAHGFGTSGTIQLSLSKSSATPQLCVGFTVRHIACPSYTDLANGAPIPTSATGTLAYGFSATDTTDSTNTQSFSHNVSIGLTDASRTAINCETNPKNPVVSQVLDTISGLTFDLGAPTFTGGAPLSDLTYRLYVRYSPWGSKHWTTTNYPVTLGSLSLSSFSNSFTAGGSYCIAGSSANSYGSSYSVALFSNSSNWTCLDHAVVPAVPFITRTRATRLSATNTGTIYLNYNAPYNGQATIYRVSIKIGTTVIANNVLSSRVGFAALNLASGFSGAFSSKITACNSFGCNASAWSAPFTPVTR